MKFNSFWSLLLLLIISAGQQVCAQKELKEIRLLVRADDMGFTHGANLGCLESFQNGIVRSVEVMVVCPWFAEAVEMLNSNKDLDPGIHLTLTSEWEKLKWRPLTCSPGITDKSGYFYPMIWKNNLFPHGSFLIESGFKIEEIEREFRAQIELGKRLIPGVSHLSAHMGCIELDAQVKDLARKLAAEYHLSLETGSSNISELSGWNIPGTSEEKSARLASILDTLKAGTYLIIEHPAARSDEMDAIGMFKNYTVGLERENILKVFCSDKVKSTIQKRGIKLISYRDL